MDDKKSDKKRYQIYVSEEVVKQFKHICIDCGFSTSQMIEKIMIELIEKNKKGK